MANSSPSSSTQPPLATTIVDLSDINTLGDSFVIVPRTSAKPKAEEPTAFVINSTPLRIFPDYKQDIQAHAKKSLVNNSAEQTTNQAEKCTDMAAKVLTAKSTQSSSTTFSVQAAAAPAEPPPKESTTVSVSKQLENKPVTSDLSKSLPQVSPSVAAVSNRPDPNTLLSYV